MTAVLVASARWISGIGALVQPGVRQGYDSLKGRMDTHTGARQTPVLAAFRHGVILSRGTALVVAMGEAADD